MTFLLWRCLLNLSLMTNPLWHSDRELQLTLFGNWLGGDGVVGGGVGGNRAGSGMGLQGWSSGKWGLEANKVAPMLHGRSVHCHTTHRPTLPSNLIHLKQFLNMQITIARKSKYMTIICIE